MKCVICGNELRYKGRDPGNSYHLLYTCDTCVMNNKKKEIPGTEIICLCGSTRFIDEFNRYRKEFSYAGKIVLSIEIVMAQLKETDPQYHDPNLKAKLDELHLRKIDLADTVFIINKGGYIGESTRKELEYARSHNKRIIFMEPEVKNDETI